MKILAFGRHKNSLARLVLKKLHLLNWDCWLVSRRLKQKNMLNWHEREVDINNASRLKSLMRELKNVDVILFTADSSAFGKITELSRKKIQDSIYTKLNASIEIFKMLLKSIDKQQAKIKLIWVTGNNSHKVCDLFLYSVINRAISGLVEQINFEFSEHFQACQIVTPLFLPSPIGDHFNKQTNGLYRAKSVQNTLVVDEITDIVLHSFTTGLIQITNKTL